MRDNLIFDILTWNESSLSLSLYIALSFTRSIFIPLAFWSYEHFFFIIKIQHNFIILLLLYFVQIILISFKISGASRSKVEPFRFWILVLYKSTWEAGVSDNIQGILIYKLCNFIFKYLVASRGRKIIWKKFLQVQ